MTRLTLRSGQDGRLLARIVDFHGDVYVIDWGEAEWVRDAATRATTGGFTVHWDGRSEVAIAGEPTMLRWLAHHYAAQGLLVFVDESTIIRPGMETAPTIDLLQDTTEVVSAAARARYLARPARVPVLRSEELPTDRSDVDRR